MAPQTLTASERIARPANARAAAATAFVNLIAIVAILTAGIAAFGPLA
ncbi:MAG: hypothetical protein KDJ90_14030 [Nitratireductor sp.]|nr:hypothetical protein [Nitratireductor sp.]